MEDLIRRTSAVAPLMEIKSEVSSDRKMPKARRDAILKAVGSALDQIRSVPTANQTRGIPVSSSEWTAEALRGGEKAEGAEGTEDAVKAEEPIPDFVPAKIDSWLVPIMTGSQIARAKYFCHECMKPVEKADVYCRHCGVRFGGEIVRHENGLWDTVNEKPVEFREMGI